MADQARALAADLAAQAEAYLDWAERALGLPHTVVVGGVALDPGLPFDRVEFTRTKPRCRT